MSTQKIIAFKTAQVSPIVKSTPLISTPQQIGKFIIQDGIATDTETGLIWLRFAHGQRWENGNVVGNAEEVSWYDALKTPQSFNTQGYAGYNDWRVPTLEEFKKLSIDADIFPKNAGTSFWSSSAVDDDFNVPDDGFNARFASFVYEYKGSNRSFVMAFGHARSISYKVRLVRTSTQSNLTAIPLSETVISQQGGQRGSDLRYNLEISLEEAVAGTEQKIRIPVLVTCCDCSENGSLSATCSTCHGKGRIKDEKILSAKIPSGVDTGDRIRLSGEGDAGQIGAPSGDLYIVIHVRPHAIFKRDGANLSCEVPISFVTACLGGEIEVPILGGKTLLKIPSKTKTGKLFRLRGKGVKPVRGGSVGDLICKVLIETHVNLTTEQKIGDNEQHFVETDSMDELIENESQSLNVSTVLSISNSQNLVEFPTKSVPLLKDEATQDFEDMF